jgi:hypothetical protein
MNVWGKPLNERADPALAACVEGCERILATFEMLPANSQQEAKLKLIGSVRSLGMSYLVTGALPRQIRTGSALERLVMIAARCIRRAFTDDEIPASATPWHHEEAQL